MKSMTIAEIANKTNAGILQGDSSGWVRAVSTDSRSISEGDIFFALRGERHDAHEFAAAAAKAGASGIVVSRLVHGLPAGIPVLLVKDTLLALQNLAGYNRAQYELPLVAVTGSAGKTTTKDIIAAVLAVKYNTLKTTGNFNNEIGLPLTLLNLNSQHQAAVVEMAMRGPGEIDFLCRIARPTSAVITNIGEAHFERLGSVENIAQAKGELLEHIDSSGFAVLNAHSPYIRCQAARCRGKVLFFGETPEAELRARNIYLEKHGMSFDLEVDDMHTKIQLPLPGKHNVFNALAAIGVGRELGLSIKQIKKGLGHIPSSGMRLEITNVEDITLINDTYNANPASMLEALSVLAQVAGNRRKIAVLGDMLELGGFSVPGHNLVGEAVFSSGVNCLVTVGSLAPRIAAKARESGFPPQNIWECVSGREAVDVLEKLLVPGDVLLVKGSRGMCMEKICQELFVPPEKAGV